MDNKFSIKYILGLPDEKQQSGDGTTCTVSTVPPTHHVFSTGKAEKNSREASGSNPVQDEDSGIGSYSSSVIESETEAGRAELESSSDTMDSSSSPGEVFTTATGANNSPTRRDRTVFTRMQQEILEFYFKACPYPDTAAKKANSHDC